MGERIQYRLDLEPDEVGTYTMTIQSGEAQLSVWSPRNGFQPNYVADDTIGQVLMTFQADEPDLYLLEVEGLIDGTTYTLQRTLTGSEESDARMNATRRAGEVNEHPLTLSTPLSLDPADVVGEQRPIYLPTISNQGAVRRTTEAGCRRSLNRERYSPVGSAYSTQSPRWSQPPGTLCVRGIVCLWMSCFHLPNHRLAEHDLRIDIDALVNHGIYSKILSG